MELSRRSTRYRGRNRLQTVERADIETESDDLAGALETACIIHSLDLRTHVLREIAAGQAEFGDMAALLETARGLEDAEFRDVALSNIALVQFEFATKRCLAPFLVSLKLDALAGLRPALAAERKGAWHRFSVSDRKGAWHRFDRMSDRKGAWHRF